MKDFWRDRYAIVPDVLTEEQIVELKTEIQQLVKHNSVYGIRQIDRQFPAISQLACSSSIIKHLKFYSDRPLKLVRAICFNKTLHSGSNLFHIPKI